MSYDPSWCNHSITQMTYWHKMPMGQFMMYEMNRAETWPFLVGMA